MAKPKMPKKTNIVKESTPTNNPVPSSPVAMSDATLSSTVTVAAPVAETQTAETPTTVTRKAARKPEIVKTEPRAKLVPINLEDEIRRLAYLLSERRGFEPGHDAEDWLAAEREIRQRYHQHSA
jgi:Protein of unknown function (DUF2934)